MRYFLGVVSLLSFFSACSSTEPVQEVTPQPEQEPVETTVPSWYNAGVHSSSDSLSVYGYSLASAADSSEAAELSTKNALEYLRFEIDRTVEEIREDLADSGQEPGTYNSAIFIIHLRNTVSDISLNSAEFTRFHETSDNGIHYSYTRSSLSKSQVFNLLEDQFENSRFTEELNTAFN